MTSPEGSATNAIMYFQEQFAAHIATAVPMHCPAANNCRGEIVKPVPMTDTYIAVPTIKCSEPCPFDIDGQAQERIKDSARMALRIMAQDLNDELI